MPKRGTKYEKLGIIYLYSLGFRGDFIKDFSKKQFASFPNDKAKYFAKYLLHSLPIRIWKSIKLHCLQEYTRQDVIKSYDGIHRFMDIQSEVFMDLPSLFKAVQKDPVNFLKRFIKKIQTVMKYNAFQGECLSHLDVILNRDYKSRIEDAMTILLRSYHSNSQRYKTDY
ncbi:unnamed protein product [Dimorphilus gyrociliatus]|uniref:Uncharacterized protein n=1 Tax=Dimorphilus gyrociliatus TaxID=2664684 RepID=A0A7I8VG48_9ANNE|nr:unnamed protein product [Dimorphilus gyrociliatus]